MYSQSYKSKTTYKGSSHRMGEGEPFPPLTGGAFPGLQRQANLGMRPSDCCVQLLGRCVPTREGTGWQLILPNGKLCPVPHPKWHIRDWTTECATDHQDIEYGVPSPFLVMGDS
ncbi:hypothetical protein AAFF_G00179830 [Aldrovandia affinis]|uniref:Uncharacterized protein n=1 Tax=Aldrovandia affinis TaxID=143900 RepID=A0AAD7SYD3_9TELE|nr:hypothetical protein AAFF_G00179830 [Aldrovandia affinis]